MADEPTPLKTVSELQLGPYNDDAGQVAAIRSIHQRLNEVIRVLNSVVTRINSGV